MSRSTELPLFPLDMVLFPHNKVPLHIFEERYKLMISECVENEGEFAIVSGTDDMFQAVGSAAIVAELVRQFDDGRMNIIVKGTRRIRVLDRSDHRPFISGTVEALEDEPEEPDAELRDRVKGLYDEAIKLSFGWMRPTEHGDTEPSELSYTVAAGLNLPLEEQQSFLELRSANERLRAVEQALGQALVGVREVKRRSGGNGHLG